MKSIVVTGLILAALGLIGGRALAQSPSAGEVNVYSARHYDSDLMIYDEFTKETGIKVNLIEAGGDALMGTSYTRGGGESGRRIHHGGCGDAFGVPRCVVFFSRSQTKKSLRAFLRSFVILKANGSDYQNVPELLFIINEMVCLTEFLLMKIWRNQLIAE
ncbi:MAG: hypothetical protein R3C40_07940 [Parvularculaceae bacterium]